MYKILPVEFLDSMRRGLPDVRGKVGGRLLDGQHHDGDNNRDTNTGQDP